MAQPMGIIIPPGWYLLSNDEILRKGDRYYNSDSGGHHDILKWGVCGSSVGTKAGCRRWLTFIREGETAPPPEREWLNPWE